MDCIEQALWRESLVLWSLGVKLLDCGELDDVDSVCRLSALIFSGVVQDVGCIV